MASRCGQDKRFIRVRIKPGDVQIRELSTTISEQAPPGAGPFISPDDFFVDQPRTIRRIAHGRRRLACRKSCLSDRLARGTARMSRPAFALLRIAWRRSKVEPRLLN